MVVYDMFMTERRQTDSESEGGPFFLYRHLVNVSFYENIMTETSVSPANLKMGTSIQSFTQIHNTHTHTQTNTHIRRQTYSHTHSRRQTHTHSHTHTRTHTCACSAFHTDLFCRHTRKDQINHNNQSRHRGEAHTFRRQT